MSAATRVRVTLTEWIGDVIPLVRNMHVSSLIAMVLMCDEVFGSVVSLLPYDDVDEVFRNISAGRFGLQTGLFTSSMELAIRAVRSIRTGGVILNGSSTWRTDQLAYGGVKDSGIGREGPRYSIRDMTEERIVLFNY